MKMKRIVFVIIIFMLYILNVDAIGAGVSGIGEPSGGGGSGVGGTTSSGYKLGPAIVLKFSLIDVSEYYPKSLYSAYMINKGSGKNNLSSIFIDNRNHNIKGQSTPGEIIGNFGATLYETNSNKIEEFPSGISFSQSVIKNIIPNSGYLNFHFNNLKSNLISCSGGSCVNTPQYEKVVIYMLKKSGILSLGVSSLDDLDISTQNSLNKYRIAIEPVYNLKKSDTNYMFATPKSIAKFVVDGYGEFGVYASSLSTNLSVTDSHGQSININPLFYQNGFNSLADMRNGEGYILSFLVPQNNNTCKIELKVDGNYYFKDKKGGEYYFDIAGDNLEYYLKDDVNTGSGCGCSLFDDIVNNPHKTNIMSINNELYQNKYNSLCLTQKCTYTKNGSNYNFVDKKGNFTSSYEEFINSGCGCYDGNVLSLKNQFSDIYSAECPSTPPTIKVSTNLKKCNVTDSTENYEIKYEETKNINSYCNLTCVETINFNDVYGKYSVKAGKYFELGKYPTLTANKNCSVDVKYSDWYDDYEEIATAQANYISETNKYNAVMNAEPVPEQCYCDLSGCHYADLYKTSYTQYTYSGGNFNSISVPLSWGGCDNDSEPSIDSTANSKFGETIGKINALFNDLKYCSEYLAYLDGTEKISKITTEKEYYTFNNELKYYYYQDYSKSGRKRNDEKEKNIDDSELVSKSLASVQSGNYLEYTTNTKQYKYFNGINSIKNETVGKDNYNTITREVKLKFEYAPKEKKYVDIYTAEISKKASDLSNPLFIDNVYDIDITAKAKTDNENYFSFTALGDDNQIYKWFEANKEVEFYNGKRSAEKEDLNRHCTYEIINDLFETCEDSNCDSKLNVVYRSVDPKDIDPNNRLLEDNQGFSNWKNTKGQTIKAKIESDAKKDITYSPENLEYSFTLDSATIAAIRGYNKDQDNIYDKWNNDLYTCVNGNECISKFITQANSGTFKDENNKDVKQFAKDISGREKWKYMTYNSSTNEWSIENYDREEMTQTLFLEYKEKLGGLTP